MTKKFIMHVFKNVVKFAPEYIISKKKFHIFFLNIRS